MSVVFDIVIAFVVLVIAVVVIKYALILGAAVLAVLWNGVVILLRNRWITAFFLWEALSLFPPTAPYVLGFEGNFAPSLRGILPWQIMMALWGGFCFAILQWSVKRRPRKLIIKNLKKIFREKGAIIGDGRTTRSFIDDYNESGLMFLDHFFMNAWGNENQESEYLAEGLQSGELKKVLYPDPIFGKNAEWYVSIRKLKELKIQAGDDARERIEARLASFGVLTPDFFDERNRKSKGNLFYEEDSLGSLMDMQRESLLKESCDEYMRAHAGSFIAETMEGCQYFFSAPALGACGKRWLVQDFLSRSFLGMEMSESLFLKMVQEIERIAPSINLSGAFLLATNPLEGAFLIRKGREGACACERCGEIFMHRELLDGHKYCSTCAAYIRNHTCSQCGNYFDFELNRHGSRILCDECLAMIEEAEENGTPVLRKVKAEDVPPAIREKLGG